MVEVQVQFTQERETKNTIRYAEVPANPAVPEELVIGTLYVPKKTLRQIGNGAIPEQITLTIGA